MSDDPTPFLTPVAAARRRPGMYVGDTRDGSGLHHMIWEVLANSLDAHFAGKCHEVKVEIHADGAVSIEDDGPGISVAPRHDGVPFAQFALTTFHDTPTLDGHAPHEHIGNHGFGLFFVNAFSSWLHLDVFRDGRHHTQHYERGVPVTELADLEPTGRTGTRLTFLPDPTIFGDTWVDPGTILEKIRELACLVPGLKLSFHDARAHRYHEPSGIVAFLRRTRLLRETPSPVFSIVETADEIAVECVAEWRDAWTSSIESYANIEKTTSGGTHVNGLLAGLQLGLREVAGDRLTDSTPARALNGLRKGLCAVVCVRLRFPRYGEPTRSRLITPAVEATVRTIVSRAFATHLHTNTTLTDRLLSQVAQEPPDQHPA